MCPTCEGAGRFIVMKAAAFKVRPDLSEAPVPTECPTCDGEGWLDGFTPPT